jgi:hypothetical protein
MVEHNTTKTTVLGLLPTNGFLKVDSLRVVALRAPSSIALVQVDGAHKIINEDATDLLMRVLSKRTAGMIAASNSAGRNTVLAKTLQPSTTAAGTGARLVAAVAPAGIGQHQSKDDGPSKKLKSMFASVADATTVARGASSEPSQLQQQQAGAVCQQGESGQDAQQASTARTSPFFAVDAAPRPAAAALSRAVQTMQSSGRPGAAVAGHTTSKLYEQDEMKRMTLKDIKVSAAMSLLTK